MTCRHCHKPLSVGATLFGCHFCGAYPSTLPPLVAEKDEEQLGNLELSCRLCLAGNRVADFLVAGCSACGVGLGLFEPAAVQLEDGRDELGFPVPSAEELERMPPQLRADHERFLEARQAVLVARSAIIPATDTAHRGLGLEGLLKAWSALQELLHENYARAELHLKLEAAANPSAAPQEVAEAANLLIRAMERRR